MNKARFVQLWERCLPGCHAAGAASVFNTLEQRYSEPHRCYHTPEHIEHCLRQHDLASDLMDEPDAVEMAIWFHDVIYNVPTDDNELLSAELFKQLAGDDANPDFCNTVYDMILATQHRHEPNSNDDKILVDVDLSSFGLPWEEMRRDSENVRREFPNTSDAEFYASHNRFMRALLDRPTFFATEFFRDRYESQARANIARLLEELQAAGFD